MILLCPDALAAQQYGVASRPKFGCCWASLADIPLTKSPSMVLGRNLLTFGKLSVYCYQQSELSDNSNENTIIVVNIHALGKLVTYKCIWRAD
jgi:hypothetical protein